MTIPVVFVGPTISREVASSVLAADYRPPVTAGDVMRVLEEGSPDAIGIIDGRFGDVPSVWHKEILLALERGVPVLGAASMGALRAAELHKFGMIGVGCVFELYRDGAIVADSEVAVAHADEYHGFRAFSEALVDVRDDVESAARLGLISRVAAELIVSCAESIFYPQRTWPAILELAQRSGLASDAAEVILGFVARRGPTLKQRDALTLLERLARGEVERPTVPVPVPRVVHLVRALRSVRLAAATGGIATDRSATLSTSQAMTEAHQDVLLRMLARRVANTIDIVPTAEILQAARRKVLESRGIKEESLGAWLVQRGATGEMFDALVRDIALLDVLQVRLEFEAGEFLPDHVRLMPDMCPPMSRPVDALAECGGER